MVHFMHALKENIIDGILVFTLTIFSSVSMLTHTLGGGGGGQKNEVTHVPCTAHKQEPIHVNYQSCAFEPFSWVSKGSSFCILVPVFATLFILIISSNLSVDIDKLS